MCFESIVTTKQSTFPVPSCTFSILSTVNCSDPTVPVNGSIVSAYQNTTEGAEIFFRCNPGLVPAGRRTATCGADGRWNPDPATLVCTCKVTWYNDVWIIMCNPFS